MTNLYHAKNGDLSSVSRKRLANEDQLQAWIAASPRLIGLDVLVPVSYTHLDVYKRQSCDSKVGILPKPDSVEPEI